MAMKQRKNRNQNQSQSDLKTDAPKSGGVKPVSADFDIPRYVKMGVLTKQGDRVLAPEEWSPELKKIEGLGAGDSFILFNVLPPHMDSIAFETLKVRRVACNNRSGLSRDMYM